MSSKQAYWSTQMVAAVTAAVWLVAFLAFLVIGGWSFWGALLVALLLAAAVFAVLLLGFREDPPPAEAPQVEAQRSAGPPVGTPSRETAAASAAAAAGLAPAAATAGAAPAAAAELEAQSGAAPEDGAAVKPSKRLPGEEELAQKKGTWRYGSDAPAGGGAAAAAEPEADRPAMLDGPRDGSADDLKKIKGVGPKLEAMLNRMGVYHFEQIATWTDREVAWVDDNLEGFKGRVSRDGWVAQARALSQSS